MNAWLDNCEKYLDNGISQLQKKTLSLVSSIEEQNAIINKLTDSEIEVVLKLAEKRLRELKDETN